MSKNEEREIAMIRSGTDLLRVIPFKPDENKVELKFDFSKQLFEVDYLRLGEERAHRMIPDSEGHLSVTYHKGNFGKKVCVHVKQVLKGSSKPHYEELPLEYFKAPSGNDISMTPICKLFFPKSVLYNEYIKKPNHEVFSLDEADNVVEVFIVGPSFDFEKAMQTYPMLNMLQLTEDIEFYANGIIETFTGKRNSIESGAIHTDRIKLSNDIRLMLISYCDFAFLEHEHTKMTKILFIENEFHEFPLLQRIVCEGDPEGLEDKFSKPHTIVEDNVLRGIDTPWLQAYADDLAEQYYPALEAINANRKKLFDEIWERIQEFMAVVFSIQEDVVLQSNMGLLKPSRDNAYIQWFSLPLWYRSFDLHLLLAKYLDRTEVSLLWQTISRNREPNDLDMRNTRNQVLLGNKFDIDQIIENHCTLALVEADIDLLYGEYNKYGGQTNTAIAVTWPTRMNSGRFHQTEVFKVLENIRSNGFFIGEEQFIECDRTFFDQMIQDRDLEQVWNHIRIYSRRIRRALGQIPKNDIAARMLHSMQTP